MDTLARNPDHKDRTRILRVIGALFLLSGIAVGLLGPLEMYCFYLFSEGGRFHYPGFGVGSFMFANIASQVVGYYVIAILLIALGYGHLTLRRWARLLALTLLWAWLVAGAPLSGVAFFILLGTKDLSLPAALIALIFSGLSYLVFPGLLIRFYRGHNVKRTLETQDAQPHWMETIPLRLLVLSALYAFYIIMLHLLILLNGIFPALGRFQFGLEGIAWLDFSIACLVCLLWGTLRQRLWAWWGAVIGLGLFTASTILTFARSSYATILAGLAFPPREIEVLEGLPIQGYHFAILVGTPLLVTWGIALLSKRYYRGMS